MNTGSVQARTWYEVHLIKRVDTGVVDVMFTTTANRATLPTNYTLQRRIGWIRNDATPNNEQFTQVDDYFTFTTQQPDVQNAAVNTNETAVELTVPPKAIARFRASAVSNTSVNAAWGMVFLEVVEGAVTPAGTTGILSLGGHDFAAWHAGHFELRVSSTSTIEHDGSTTTGAPTFSISTYGWIDHREKMSNI
jgi:hypothetical protein